MKLPELKKRLANRYSVRIIAGVLTIALLGSSVTAYTVYADNDKTAEASAEDSDELNAEDILGNFGISDENIGKDESVYFISDASGNIDSTIVVDHLSNPDGKDTLEDASNLTDIENVKGDEEFTQNGNSITWKANGKDIYYQGKTTEGAPVSQSVTYFLDGNEISPEELAGKSGKVTIRFDYENNSCFKEDINGEEVEVKIPFAAITAVVLDNSFSNVSITNGKLENTGTSSIALGYALPGLKESLDLSEDTLGGGIEIPEYFEITADVENFSLSTAMTVVVNAGSFVTREGDSDTDAIDEIIDKLTDASGQLQDGSGELADGVGTLKNSLGDFSTGMDSLSKGLKAYTDGAAKLDDGIGQVKDGVDKLDGSKKTLADGVKQLADGADAAVDGSKKLTDGTKALLDGTKQLESGAQTLATGATALAEGASQVDTGAGQLKSGASQVSGGLSQLAKQTPTLEAGAKQVSEGATALATGAAQVDAGVDTLVDSLNGMSGELASTAQAIVGQLAPYDAIFKALGVGSVTVSNIGTAADAVAANQQAIVGVLMQQGASQEQAVAQYGKLLAGVYQAKGALEVIGKVSNGLSANAGSLGQLTAGTESLKSGASDLAAGAGQVYAGTQAVNTAVGQLDEGAAAVSKGASDLAAGTSALKTGASDLNTGAATLSAGTTSVKKGAKELHTGNKALGTGLNKLDKGLDQLSGKMPTLLNGIKALKNGVDKLHDGSNELVSNNGDLLSGVGKLVDGTGKIVDGVDKLNDGANKLADGIVEFNEEGINKLVNAYDGDLKPLTTRLQAVIDAGSSYQTFTDKAEKTRGSVKFIYKLGSIEAADEE